PGPDAMRPGPASASPCVSDWWKRRGVGSGRRNVQVAGPTSASHCRSKRSRDMSTEPLVLAVDDEAGILRLIKLELSTQGFRVIAAGSGEEALRMAEEQRPDIALLDIVMPDMTGLEVMRKLRERTSIPIILLTAKGSDADKVRGLELGAED